MYHTVRYCSRTRTRIGMDLTFGGRNQETSCHHRRQEDDETKRLERSQEWRQAEEDAANKY